MWNPMKPPEPVTRIMVNQPLQNHALHYCKENRVAAIQASRDGLPSPLTSVREGSLGPAGIEVGEPIFPLP